MKFDDVSTSPTKEISCLQSAPINELKPTLLESSPKPLKKAQQVKILNVSIDNLSKAELLEQVKQGVIFTPNVDHLIKLQSDPDFYKAYSIADYRVCDSKILYYFSKFLGSPIQEKISGSDFFPSFYNYHKHNTEIRIFLLGAQPEVAKKAQLKINQKIGRDIIVDTYSPPFGFEHDLIECQKIIDLINHSDATVLAIGVGAPKQEKWLYQHRHRLSKVKIFLAIGATIDFEAGHKPRAPHWISEMGFEWLFRLLSEPRRLWKRYLVDDLRIFWLLLKQKYKLYQPPMYEFEDLIRLTDPTEGQALATPPATQLDSDSSLPMQ
jgi:N-acetylglucosaminyldiphosphoundecaprenol N-acetyl-beta-D-mannosaminyltransferase